MKMNRFAVLVTFVFACACGLAVLSAGSPGNLIFGTAPGFPVPVIDGEWWNVTGNPMDHAFATENQEPVDFAVWQAKDGTWQMWSCFRKTKAGGEKGLTRFFYRWEGRHPTDRNWKPMGIVMDADPGLGETPGGLQAPHVVKVGDLWHMFYGDWVNICHAASRDGKRFERVVQPNGKTGMFSEGPSANTRDIMLLEHRGLWYAYYTGRAEGSFGVPGSTGRVWLRTTADFKFWSEPEIVSFGGQAGTGNGSSECPFVVKKGEDDFYLFKTQTYGDYDRAKNDIRHRGAPRTSVYHSTDPRRFGINQDVDYYIGQLPVAAPEIVTFEGQDYIFALKTGALDGMRCAKLKWVREK